MHNFQKKGKTSWRDRADLRLGFALGAPPLSSIGLMAAGFTAPKVSWELCRPELKTLILANTAKVSHIQEHLNLGGRHVIHTKDVPAE
jgi:hypothetical protein